MKSYLELKNISKHFSGVQALSDVSFKVEGGQVCALLGENGDALSQSIKIMSGVYKQDTGDVIIDGEKMHYSSPLDAIKKGISVIYQERQLVKELTVAENVYMANLPSNRIGIINYSKAFEEVQNLITDFNLPFSAKDPVKKLSVAHQQMVEIMKAYRRNSKIIAFDEPTACLTDDETDVLFRLIRRLSDEGKIILYVSHRMAELSVITNKIIVFKDGKVVGERLSKESSVDELIRMMVGRDIGGQFSEVKFDRTIGEVVLETQGLTTSKVKNISFYVRKGEILGFAGLVGAGRSEMANALFGIDEIKSGKIFVKGKEVTIKCSKDAIKAGIGLCPEDRKEMGLVLGRSVKDNINISLLKRLSKYGVLSKAKETELASDAIKKFNIKTSSMDKIVKELSGGNQQKVVLARWLSVDLDILILDEPTKGIDVGAKAEIYGMISDLAAQGYAIILISSELPEIINICDRAIVMAEGYITGELSREEFSEVDVLKLAMIEH